MAGVLKAKEANCSTANDLFTALERFQAQPLKWIFRGQMCASWPLRPTIERHVPVADLLAAELKMYDDFRGRAHLYTNVLPKWDDDVSWLASMQHHGIPTRLLDWTYSPLVALFFAVVEPAKDNCASSLWAIDLERLNDHVSTIGQELFSLLGRTRYSDPSHFRRVAFPYDAGTGLMNMSWEEEPDRGFVVPILPQFQSLRLSSQQGLFLCNCNYKITFDQSLAAMVETNPVESTR